MNSKKKECAIVFLQLLIQFLESIGHRHISLTLVTGTDDLGFGLCLTSVILR